jgi:hypothetical protein
MTNWVCANCGGNDVTESAARPSLDTRYAVGFCRSCAPSPTEPQDTRKLQRAPSTVPLVRADLFDPQVITDRKQRRADAQFLAKCRDGKVDIRVPANAERQRALLARYDDERLARHVG